MALRLLGGGKGVALQIEKQAPTMIYKATPDYVIKLMDKHFMLFKGKSNYNIENKESMRLMLREQEPSGDGQMTQDLGQDHQGQCRLPYHVCKDQGLHHLHYRVMRRMVLIPLLLVNRNLRPGGQDPRAAQVQNQTASVSRLQHHLQHSMSMSKGRSTSWMAHMQWSKHILG